MYSHIFYTPNSLNFTPPNASPVSYDPASDYPNDVLGMRFGFGNYLVEGLPFGYELDYNQTFTKSKISNDFSYGISTKSFVASLFYTLNPKDRIRVNLLSGLVVLSVNQTINSVTPEITYSTSTITTDVDPFLGCGVIYQINAKWAVRFVEFYDFGTYNQNLSGRVVSLLMLNFYPE